MNITVFGLWHQGCVAAACTARHFNVTGLDANETVIAGLQRGAAPLLEPGLDARIQEMLGAGRLRFTTDLASACATADILWVTFDTPVDEQDRADVELVLREVRRAVPALPAGALVLVSSQLPVGTCRLLEAEFGPQGYRFACSPENLRLGSALKIFEQADRVIVGCRDERSREQLRLLFQPFTQQIVWMSCESAEMTKHAINSFLAVSITFMNELARLCELTGADAKEVERGLKSESRIGPKAYLSPGAAFAGGTLARDVVTLTTVAARHGEQLELIPAIKRSNDQHRRWAFEKLLKLHPSPQGCRIALFGLTYKAGTSTLRRSSAVELAAQLAEKGFAVTAYDPSIEKLPPELNFIALSGEPKAAATGAHALVLCTEWPVFRQLDWSAIVASMQGRAVVDATRFLEQQLLGHGQVQYLSVGSPS